jgi:L-seryl-tRNA(Ser) seleniumtransferase
LPLAIALHAAISMCASFRPSPILSSPATSPFGDRIVNFWTQWTRHFGPLSGSEPKLADPVQRYILTAFTFGCNLGPAQAVRHLQGLATAHELSFTNRRHLSVDQLDAVIKDLITAYHRCDLPKVWGSTLHTRMTNSAAVYERLGVRPIVNAVGPATRLGGTTIDPEVLAAMAGAASACVPIDELQERAGQVIADNTGAQAGYVTCGAAAGLALAAAACMTGLDPTRINRLPDVNGMPHQIIVHRTQRYDYDHALRAVGARLVEVGFPDLTFAYEIEQAITPLTAAVAYYPTPSRPALSLVELVAIAHAHQVPVIVDAAMELLPTDNLRAFIAAGADLVAFSGGKVIRGPQASGFLCGRADLIRAVALNHQDMDVRPATWGQRALMAPGAIVGPPHHGVGRAMKVGKEEIVGLIVALQRFVAREEAAERAAWLAKIEYVAGKLTGMPGVQVEIVDALVPSASIRLDEGYLARTAYDVLNELSAGEVRVFLNEKRAWQGILGVNPIALRDGDERLVADRLRTVLGTVRPRLDATARR